MSDKQEQSKNELKEAQLKTYKNQLKNYDKICSILPGLSMVAYFLCKGPDLDGYMYLIFIVVYFLISGFLSGPSHLMNILNLIASFVFAGVATVLAGGWLSTETEMNYFYIGAGAFLLMNIAFFVPRKNVIQKFDEIYFK